MRTLNLGILAHVDAGETSLTERLLYAAGVIDEVGSVDGGSTQTDTLALEQERGITIESDVVSFVVDDVAINLIDTPGHPDLIAEVGTDHNPLDRDEYLLRGGSSQREIFIHGCHQHAFR
jgi:ribosomal protection tetracycline resistance protein